MGLFELGRYLISRGHYVTYLLRQTTNGQKYIDRIGSRCKIIRIPNSQKGDIKPRELGSILDELSNKSLDIFSSEVKNPSIVHSQYWIGGACADRICQLYKIRHIHSFLSLGRFYINNLAQMDSKQCLRDKWELQIYSQAERLIAQSAFVGNHFLKLYPEISPDKLNIIPHGVDHELFAPRPENPNYYLRRSSFRFN